MMKYTRSQFKSEFYQLWETGDRPLIATHATLYSVKFRASNNSEYSLVTVHAENIPDALEQACYSVASHSLLRPEDIDLHSVYDMNGNLLWGDQLAYAIAWSESDIAGMNRRNFLKTFGLTSAALLFGVRPKSVRAATTSVSLSGTASGLTYVDDVFSTYVYTGNGATQTINNGLDLLGKGGLVWIKDRSNSKSHYLIDSARGSQYSLNTNTTTAQAYESYDSNFTSTGFNVKSTSVEHPTSDPNASGANIVSWAFRKAANFFDVVAYNGDNSGTRTLTHSLGVQPGMIICRAINGGSYWFVRHCSGTSNKIVYLNTTDAETTADSGAIPSLGTSLNFSVGSLLNASGTSYVAYLFAHDPAPDGLIQCGSFATDGSGNASVNLGWEPQFVIDKTISTTSNWYLFDTIRGASVATPAQIIFANSNSAELNGTLRCEPNATGFSISNSVASATHIYLAIRRSNKPPTSGSQIYKAIARTGTSTAVAVTGVGFAPDLAIIANRTNGAASGLAFVYDKVRGASNRIQTRAASAETWEANTLTSFTSDGCVLGADSAYQGVNNSAYGYINWFFRRAPGVLDIVCYKGTGAVRTVRHNLQAAPELMIVKRREAVGVWTIFASSVGVSKSADLSSTTAFVSDNGAYWNSTLPTSTQFTVGAHENQNANGATYVAYLFATLPGISKVGSYAGNGGTQTVNCGFTGGARFILIKRADLPGDWYVWDTTRGITAGIDPHLRLNSFANEEATDDSIDSDNSGFIVNQTATTTINAAGGTYIYLAIS